MNSGRYVLSYTLDLVDRKPLSRLVRPCDAQCKVRHFDCRQPMICTAYAQLTWREGLRDIATCLNARGGALYHSALERVTKTPMADANEQRDWRRWEDLAKGLARRVSSTPEKISDWNWRTRFMLWITSTSPRGLPSAGVLPKVVSTTIDFSLCLSSHSPISEEQSCSFNAVLY